MEFDGVELGLYLAAAGLTGAAVYDIAVRRLARTSLTVVGEPMPMTVVIHKLPPIYVPLLVLFTAAAFFILGLRRRVERKRPLRFRPARRF